MQLTTVTGVLNLYYQLYPSLCGGYSCIVAFGASQLISANTLNKPIVTTTKLL